MPIFTIHKPPSMPPATLAHRPAFLATTPISVLRESHVEVERRGERRGHAVAELVEEDERSTSSASVQPCAVDEFVERLDDRLAQRPRRACGERGSLTSSVIATPGSMNSAVMMKTDDHGSRSERISASDPGTRLEIRYALT